MTSADPEDIDGEEVEVVLTRGVAEALLQCIQSYGLEDLDNQSEHEIVAALKMALRDE